MPAPRGGCFVNGSRVDLRPTAAVDGVGFGVGESMYPSRSLNGPNVRAVPLPGYPGVGASAWRQSFNKL
jgi:hypothetical protein